MARTPHATQSRSEVTRAALIQAATEAFARAGFDAVSTRDIAAAAEVHPALIGYHFGGKEGLYLAVFEHIAATVEQRIGPALDQIEQMLASRGGKNDAAARAMASLGKLCDAMVAMLADPGSGPWAALIMREQQAPTAAFDLVYERFMRRVLATMTQLVRTADPTRDALEARLTVVALLGQMVVFRVARAGVMRHLEWRSVGPEEQAQMQAMIRRHLAAILGQPSTA